VASAGTVTVDFAAETAKFTAELKKVNDRLKGMESGFDSVAKIARNFLPSLSVAAIGSFVKSSLAAADALGDMADRIGVSVKELSRLQFAAGQSDVEIEALNKSLERVNIVISDAANGVTSAQKALSALNLSASDLRSLGLEQQLGKIADQFKEIQNPADKVRIATDLFGKSGAQLIPLLNKGSAGMNELAAAADRLGISLDERAVAGIDRADNALNRFLQTISRGTANRTGTLIADIFGSGDEIADIQAKIDRIKQQREALLQSTGGEITSGPGFDQLDQQIRQLEAEKNLLNFQRFRADAQRALNEQKELTNQLAFEEINITLQARGATNENPFAELDEQFRQQDLERQQAFFEEAARLSDQASQIALEQALTQGEEMFRVQDEARAKIAERHAFWLEVEQRDEMEAKQRINRIQQDGYNAAYTLLTAYGGKYKKYAQVLLAFEKAKAIANIIVETQESASKAMATYGYPLGLAAAAGAIAFGAARIAAVASTVIGSSNAPQIGSPGAPVFTSNADTSFQNDERATAQAQSTVQVIFNGNVYNTDDFQRSIVDALKEVSDRDVIIFSGSSAQAQVIRG
jgi:hypothetical protein